MIWIFLSKEKGQIVDKICDKYRTGFSLEDCPDCPIRSECHKPRKDFPKDTHEFLKLWEESRYKAAMAYNNRQTENAD